MPKQNISFKVLFPWSLLLLLTITACGETASDTESESGAENPQTIVEDLGDKPVEGQSAVDSAVETETGILTDVVLALSGDGLMVVEKQSRKTRTIAFDTDITTSITAVASALGEPTEKTQNSECGAGAMNFITWSNGLTMNAIQERFVGWTIRPTNTESPNLTTLNDIGLGKTLTDLKANYSVEVIESTLGTEFIISDSLFGLLSANEPDGVITYLWSGIACNFR